MYLIYCTVWCMHLCTVQSVHQCTWEACIMDMEGVWVVWVADGILQRRDVMSWCGKGQEMSRLKLEHVGGCGGVKNWVNEASMHQAYLYMHVRWVLGANFIIIGVTSNFKTEPEKCKKTMLNCIYVKHSRPFEVSFKKGYFDFRNTKIKYLLTFKLCFYKAIYV